MPARTRAVLAAAIPIVLAFLAPPCAAATPEMVARLEVWIDANSDLPRAEAPPVIVFADAAEEVRDAATAIGGRVRGLYDPETAAITLIRPWSGADPADVSVLLHELVHHRQSAVHFYCPGAKELPAYRLQEKWLAENGLALDVNWVGVVLASGCARRDVHPD